MSPLTEPPLPSSGGAWLRCLIWLLLLAGWTSALVLPVPIQANGNPAWEEPLFTLSKSLHVGVYALFAATGAWLTLPLPWRWPVLALLMGHGMLTEFLQAVLEQISHRSGKWSDVGLDLLGIALGAALTWKRWPSPPAENDQEKPVARHA